MKPIKSSRPDRRTVVRDDGDGNQKLPLPFGASSIEHVPTSQLKASPTNARTHSKKQIRQVAASFRRFGFLGAIPINGSSEILAGHARVEAARQLGMETVPCIRVEHLSRAEERAFALADNRLALSSGWDNEQLAETFAYLAAELPELENPGSLWDTGFEPAELDAVLAAFEEPQSDPDDDLPEISANPVTQAGDLWQLGRNRLLCGDARDARAYQRLMAGLRAGVVVTDPPWNVAVNGHVGGRGKVKHEEFAFASGEMSDRQYRRFLTEALGAMASQCRDGALLYVFIDWRHVAALCEVGVKLGFDLRNICVWHKTTPGQGSHYRSAHELICVFQKPGAPAMNNIMLGRYGRSRSNVWSYPAPNKFVGKDDPLRGHPTPKPVQMLAEAIKDASARGDIVLDGFLGSGSTLLAAEKVGRTGFGIEYEPIYVDLAIRRWQGVTGKDAVLEATGETFEEVAAARADPSASGQRPPQIKRPIPAPSTALRRGGRS